MPITINGTGSISGLTATGISAQPKFPGNVLQVVQTAKTDNFTTSSTTFTDITGLSASITPSSSSNKILIFGDVSVGGANGAYLILQLVKSSTAIYIGTDSKTFIGSKFWFPTGGATSSSDSMGNLNLSFLDSPTTTSSVTYKIQMRMSSAITGGINRRNASDDTSAASSITLLEVAA